jgi:predicted ribosomally synthesized peptide with nif11-like leader
MAAKNVIAFYDQVVADPALQEQLKAALVGAADSKATVAERVARLAVEAGHSVTAQEVETAMREVETAPARDLSDTELEAVVGGVAATQPKTPPAEYASNAKGTYNKILTP